MLGSSEVERCTVNALVVGSIPTRADNINIFMIIDKIVVFGCSFSYGSELFSEEDANNNNSINFAYGKHLANILKCDYLNLSLPGASNFEIGRRVQQFVDFNKKDNSSILIVIGWAELNRFSFSPDTGFDILNKMLPLKNIFNFSSYTAGLCKLINSKVSFFSNSEIFKLAKESNSLKEIIKLSEGTSFVSFFEKNIFNSSYFYDLNYMIRQFTSNFLLQNKIKFITFPCLGANNYINIDKYESSINKQFNILEKYNNFNFYDYYRSYGLRKGGHINEDGHKEFAKYLYKEIIDRKIFL